MKCKDLRINWQRVSSGLLLFKICSRTKNYFSSLDVSLFNQKDDIDLHIGLVTKSKLRKWIEEDIGNIQVDFFYNSMREFYKTAYMYCVKWLPLDNVLYKNCTFLDFSKKSSAGFHQVMSIVEGFPTWNKELCSGPQHLDACEEQFMMYQGLSKENIPENIWNEAKVEISTTEKDFYRMDIIWEYLRDKISYTKLCRSLYSYYTT